LYGASVEPSSQQPLTSPLVDLFLELCAIPSPSGQERAVADRVGAFLSELGLEWDEDDATTRLEGDTGNIYCRIPPTNDGGTPIFLCAHTDTVPPERAIEPVVGEDGIIRNAAGTILGSDNKAAVVVLLESTKRILDERRPHAGIELLFTAQEEISLRGADAFDHTRLGAEVGYVYDQGAPIGEIVLGSPHARVLDFRFHGRSAHAGMFPEDGRSAVAAASRAIADFRLGRIDEETSANVGLITGGTARNVVPEWCSFSAEVRSHDERKAVELVREMLETAAFAASLGECEVESEVRPSFPGYRFRESDKPVALAATALRTAGFEPRYALSGGGADANVFNARGFSCVNLANGMMEIHTPDEHIAVADLDAMVEVTLALVDAARES
jgi:tripeptide aminopeptidase